MGKSTFYNTKSAFKCVNFHETGITATAEMKLNFITPLHVMSKKKRNEK